MTPRPYQAEGVANLFHYFTIRNGNPLLVYPTGTGKAFVQAEFIRQAIERYPATRFLNLTHVKELVEQNHKELLGIWPQAPAGVYSAGLKRKDTHMQVTFGGVQSVVKRAEWFGHIDLVMIDEAHTVSEKEGSSYDRVIKKLKERNDRLKVIGLTATDYRLGTGKLTSGGLFTDVIVDYSSLEAFNYLVDQGYLCPLVPKRTETELDVSDVGMSGGEFIQAQLQEAADKVSITRAALDECVKLASQRRHWLVFATGVKHAEHICEMLNERGISSLTVHSDLTECARGVVILPGEEPRDAHIRYFKEGKVKALVNVGVLTTGFNFPALDCIIMLRPTNSPGLWVQMLGRGTRPYNVPGYYDYSPQGKPNCLVLDFAANTRRLGPINDPVIPTRGKKSKTGLVPYKTCPQCATYNHTRARFCIECGFVFPENFAAGVNAATDELIKKTEKKFKPAPLPKPPVETVIDTHYVQRAEYAKNPPKDPTKPPTLRATYYCGGRVFNEWLCFEHAGFPWKKAKDAWRLMGGGDIPPETIDEALALVQHLRPPTQLRVMHGGKWPEIVGYEFGENAPPAIAVDDLGDPLPVADDPGTPRPAPQPALLASDDEIPF